MNEHSVKKKNEKAAPVELTIRGSPKEIKHMDYIFGVCIDERIIRGYWHFT
ncbi:hypothetical protein [Siminovitchia fortis]|uniref:hypothetical protein n=1 Tax=Siminovitchia fortis TaxID=254758 RepID=UPI00164371C7|nr:hypothetical protein [Siminovitchia fortis]